jgi:hypothetical protein
VATPFLSLSRFTRAGFAALLFASASASALHAQSAPTSETSQPPAPASASAQSAAQVPAKKVWTNENLGASHNQPDNSARASQPGPNSGSTAPAKPKNKKDASWYRDQIAKLKAQIPPLDKTIAELQAALEGKTLNEPLHYGGNRIGDWKEQLQALQTKRQATLDKISALEDEARHNGVEPNALP